MLMILACLFPAFAGTLVCVSGMQIRTRNRCLGACVLATDLLCAAAALQGGRVSFLTLSENLHMTFAADDMGLFFLAAVLLLYLIPFFGPPRTRSADPDTGFQSSGSQSPASRSAQSTIPR